MNSASYPLLDYRNKYIFNFFNFDIHLDDVDCYGNESKLVDCRHRGIGIHNCGEGRRHGAAGVICTSRFPLI